MYAIRSYYVNLNGTSNLEIVKALRDAGVTMMAMELLPRITRAQSMDILSSQATVAGYKAVLRNNFV